MTVRRFAYLIAFFAAVLTAYTHFIKPANIRAANSICRDSSNSARVIVHACSKLIELRGISDRNLSFFLRKRGWAFKRLRQYENALADIDRVLEIRPDYIHAWVLRARINDANGSYDFAANDFETALALNPERISTLTRRAKIYFKRENYESALRDYERVLDIKPDHKWSRGRIAVIHEKLGRIDLALKALDQAIKISPDSASLYLYQGVLHVRYTGDGARALKAFARADELSPNQAFIHLYISMAYRTLNEEELSKSHVEKFALLFVQNITSEMGPIKKASYHLGETYFFSNHGAQRFFRGLGYSASGHADLARFEFKQYLEHGGLYADRILKKVIRRQGFCLGSCSGAGEGSEFYEELDKYIEYMASLIFRM